MIITKIFLGFTFIFGSLAFGTESDYWGLFREKPAVSSNLISAKILAKPSAEVLKKYPAAKFRTFSVDLDQDGQADYIIEAIGKQQTCFVKSDLKLQSCEKSSFATAEGFAYEYFLSTGKNQMLLLINLSGDEDSSDFSIERFDPNTWKKKRVTKINSLIEVNSKKYKGIYWGYPWDITDITISNENGEPSIPIVFENGFEKDPEGTKGPALVFTGTPTQGESTGSNNKLKSKIKYIPLKDLESALIAGHSLKK